MAPPAPEYDREMIETIRIPFSTRISFQADQQLQVLMDPGRGRTKKRTKTDLLAEALNLLFKKYGMPQVAD
jgi:hypothetical protein